MTAEEMFNRFCKKNNIHSAAFDAWSFGTQADTLADLVLQGKKTATSSLLPAFVGENDPLPQPGNYSVLLNSHQEAVCVLRTTAVYVCEFKKVPPLHAAKEGEGDGSLRYWREVHRAFFADELAAYGMEFDETVPVVCEEFERLC